jgi:hypothetical protein
VPLFYYVEKGGGQSVSILAAAFLSTTTGAICVVAKQHTQAQVETLYIFSIEYYLYGTSSGLAYLTNHRKTLLRNYNRCKCNNIDKKDLKT